MANLKIRKRTEPDLFTKEDVQAGERQLPLYYSVSQLDMSNRCRRQRYFRYACGLKIPPNFNMIGGTSVHKAAEIGMRAKQKQKQIKESDHVEQAVERFKEAWEQPHLIEESKSQCIDLVVAMTLTWRRELMPNRFPLPLTQVKKIKKIRSGIPDASLIAFTGIEQEFWINLPGLSKYVMGFIDLIDSQPHVVDLKTGRKMKNENDLRSHQLATYVIAAKKLGWPTPKKVALDCVVAPTGKHPEGYAETLAARAPGRDRLLHTIDGFKAMESADKRGDFPAQYGQACSWCGYKKLCDKVGSVSYHV